MHRESISVKNFIGLKPQMFSPANLSTFTVIQPGNLIKDMIRIFVKIWLDLRKAGFHMHQKDTFHYHTIAVHINNTGKYWYWKLSRLLLVLFAPEACQMSMSTKVIFKWLPLPWTSRQPAINHHTSNRWGKWHQLMPFGRLVLMES